MKIYEYFKNKPKAEILKKTAKLANLNRKNLSLTIILHSQTFLNGNVISYNLRIIQIIFSVLNHVAEK